jgi:hypothetical protein
MNDAPDASGMGECPHSLRVDGVCAHCRRNILQEAASALAIEQADAPDEIAALATIVSGFERLPEEARARAYSYLIARFPQRRITR